MLSFRDRFFTPKVSTAMMSPSGIIAAGGGAGAGILIGGVLGPAGMVVGGVLGAIAAWAVRVGLAIPKAPEQERIDPFTISEPWRRLTQDALSARTQFNDAVRRTRPGPIRERLETIGERISETISEVWASARAGHELADAFGRVNATGARQELDQLAPRHAETFDFTTQQTIDSLKAQVATAERMERMILETRNRLALLNARLDEAVARAIELSVGTYRPDEFTELEGAFGSITDELEALRGAIEDTSGGPAVSPNSMPTTHSTTLPTDASTEPSAAPPPGVPRQQGQ